MKQILNTGCGAWGGKSLVYQSQLGGIELFPLQIHFTVYLVIFHIRQIGVVDLYQLFSASRDIRVNSCAIACDQGCSQSGGLLDGRNLYRDAQYIRQDLAPERALEAPEAKITSDGICPVDSCTSSMWPFVTRAVFSRIAR